MFVGTRLSRRPSIDTRYLTGAFLPLHETGFLTAILSLVSPSNTRMSQNSDDESEGGSSRIVSPEGRIKELNDIDHDISQLLSHASKAIVQLPNENYETPNPKLEDVKEKFETLTRDYYTTLSAISVRLRRQVYALEEASLIRHGRKQDADRASSMNENQSSRREGGGALDNSYLNVRAKDVTGQSIKRQVLQEAKGFLDKTNIDVQSKSPDVMHIDT